MFLQPKPRDPGRPRRQWRDVMDADGKHSARSRNRQACSASCSASCPANQVALRSTKLIRMRLWTGAYMEAQLKGLASLAWLSCSVWPLARRHEDRTTRGASMFKGVRRSAVHGVCAAAALALSPVTATTQAEPDRAGTQEF